MNIKRTDLSSLGQLNQQIIELSNRIILLPNNIKISEWSRFNIEIPIYGML